MEHSEPVTGHELLAPFADALLGRTLVRLWRLAATSGDGAIPLLGTLVLESADGFVVLSYTQTGLSCRGPLDRTALRWDVEPELTMGRTGVAEEWLELAALEDQPARPRLPITVTGLTGWFGTGLYTDTFAVALRAPADELVIATTDQFDLMITTRADALARAETLSATMDFTLLDASRGT